MRLWLTPLALAILLALACPRAHAQSTAACRPGTSDDTLRPLPPSLTAKAMDLFGIKTMPPKQVRRSTVVRCMDGRLLACNTGADLPCGKADTRRDLPAAHEWCYQNPNAGYIPAYIAGQANIYHWHCERGQPTTSGPPAPWINKAS